MTLFIIFSCLGKVISNEELLKKDKSDILNYFEKEILDIEESNKEKLLNIAIERLGDKEDLIYSLWGKGIITFDSSCFCRSEKLNIDVVEFIFSKINEEKKVECLKNLICNKEMLDEIKVDLAIKILKRDLVNIEECNKQGILDVAIEHLGFREHLIGILWGKGITKFDPLFFSKSKKMSIDVIDFIFNKINEKKKVECLKNLICNKEIPEKNKIYLVSYILNELNLDSDLFGKEKVLEEALINLGNKEDIIEKIGIIEFDSSSFVKAIALSLDSIKLIFENIDGDKLISCLENIIKNKKIGNQEKEDIVKEILKMDKLDEDKCNEKENLNTVIGFSGRRKEVLDILWNRGIKKFNFIKILNEGDEFSYGAIEFLFEKLSEEKILDIFSEVLLSEEVEEYRKTELIMTMLEEFLQLKKQVGVLVFLRCLEDEEIVKLLKKAFLEKNDVNDVNITGFLLNNLIEDKAAEAFKNLIDDSDIEKGQKIEATNAILELEIGKDLLEQFNKREILWIAIEHLVEEEALLSKLWDKGIVEFNSERFHNAKQISRKAISFLFNKLNKEKIVNCFKHLISNKKMKEKEKAELITLVLENDLVDVEECNKENIYEVAKEHLGKQLLTEFIEKGINDIKKKNYPFSETIETSLSPSIIEFIEEEVERKIKAVFKEESRATEKKSNSRINSDASFKSAERSGIIFHKFMAVEVEMMYRAENLLKQNNYILSLLKNLSDSGNRGEINLSRLRLKERLLEIEEAIKALLDGNNSIKILLPRLNANRIIQRRSINLPRSRVREILLEIKGKIKVLSENNNDIRLLLPSLNKIIQGIPQRYGGIIKLNSIEKVIKKLSKNNNDILSLLQQLNKGDSKEESTSKIEAKESAVLDPGISYGDLSEVKDIAKNIEEAKNVKMKSNSKVSKYDTLKIRSKKTHGLLSNPSERKSKMKMELTSSSASDSSSFQNLNEGNRPLSRKDLTKG